MVGSAAKAWLTLVCVWWGVARASWALYHHPGLHLLDVAPLLQV